MACPSSPDMFEGTEPLFCNDEMPDGMQQSVNLSRVLGILINIICSNSSTNYICVDSDCGEVQGSMSPWSPVFGMLFFNYIWFMNV